MSVRLFRYFGRKKINFLMTRRGSIPSLLDDMGDVEPLCEGLSQEELEHVSIFRGEVNMMRAERGEDSIELVLAMKYLKASKFDSDKALIMYKNYQKYRDSHQLDNLRVHREPLCSEIGSRKLELLGTYDKEGSPLAVFTASRHTSKHSDTKACIQLLFYTLNQAAESEHSQDAGVVFLMDMRDASLSCTSYLSNILSVLRDGYPLYVKSIYFIDTPLTIKKSPAIARCLKQDALKVKHITFSELSLHFDMSQLPLTLGGSYIPGKEPTYPFCALKTTRPIGQRNRIQRVENEPPRGASNGTVNNLTKVFESKDEPTVAQDRPYARNPVKEDTHAKPLPPTPLKQKRYQGSQQQTQRKGSLHGKQNGSTPTPAKPTDDTVADVPKTKALPLPPVANTKPVIKKPVCLTNSDSEVLNEEPKPKPVASRIKNWIAIESKPEPSKPVAPKTASNGRKNLFVRQDSEEKLTSSWSPSAVARGVTGRTGSDGHKASKPKPHVPMKVLSNAPETKQPLLPPNVRNRQRHSGYENSKPEHERPGFGYENHDFNTPRKTSRSFDKELAGRSDYENISSSTHDQSYRDSQCYENVHSTPQLHVAKPQVSYPAPTEPAPQYEVVGKNSPVVPGHISAEYEVIDFNPKQKPQPEDGYASDDETLFGKEGPPGMIKPIYENFGPDEGNKFMTLAEFERHINNKGKNGLAEEYIRIRNEPLVGSYKECKRKCNLSKNRYKDVVCYDESRVKLKPVKDLDGSDYVHANYVSGHNKPEAFILTQGPKDKTVADFWRMVWEKQVHVIVMVTKCVEMMKRKCAEYWPETSGAVAKHGSFSVELIQIQPYNGFEERSLKLSFNGSERTVTHYQFLAWPDYGVPSNGSVVLDLLFAARDVQARIASKHSRDFKHPWGPPVLVHCSAGVGRSGAFCALDNSIDELAEKRKVNLQGIVRKMRLQRAYCIQTEEQYEFCYRTLLEYAKSMT